MPLSLKKQTFVLEYLKDYCATKAAIRTGYSAKTAKVTACKLMKEPQIKAAIKEARAEIKKTLDIEMQDILQPLVQINRAKLTDYYDEKGELIPLGPDCPNPHAIKSISEKTQYNKKGKPIITRKIELHPATGVNERLAVLAGLENPEALEVKTNDFTFRLVKGGTVKQEE